MQVKEQYELPLIFSTQLLTFIITIAAGCFAAEKQDCPKFWWQFGGFL